MSTEKAKQAFRQGKISKQQFSRVRLAPKLAELKSADGARVLLADLIRLLKQLHDQAVALGNPGRHQVPTVLLDELRIPDVTLCDVDVEAKPASPKAAAKLPDEPPLDARAQRELVENAKTVLKERNEGKFQHAEDLFERVDALPNPRQLKQLLFDVKKSWVAMQSGDHRTDFEGLDGIREYLPTRQEAAFDGILRDAGTGRTRGVLLEVTGQVASGFEEAVRRSTSRATGYLKLRYASPEAGSRLAKLHAAGLPVRVVACVRLSIKDGAPADFCVTGAYPWAVSDEAIQAAVDALVEELRRPLPSVSPWQA